MGKVSEWIEVSRGSENNWLGTCEANHVGISPQEDRGRAAGEVGAGEGRKEKGGIELDSGRK